MVKYTKKNKINNNNPLTKKFKKIKIYFRESNIYKDEILNEYFYDTNGKYYKIYKYIYNVNYDIENNNNNNDKLEVIKDLIPLFYNIASKKCIPLEYKKYTTIYNKNNLKKKDGYLFLEYNNINLYKVMDGFFDISSEKKYQNENQNIPFWFSAPYYAYMNIVNRWGGVCAYKLIKNKKLNIFVINCNNIKKLIYLCQTNLPKNIKLREYNLTKQYLINLLRLVSCSEKNLENQLSIYSNFYNYNNKLWLRKDPIINNMTLCNIKKIDNDYFGITKNKGYHNYNLAYLLQYINKNYFNNFYDGYILINKYTPYFLTGVTLEEVVLFNAYSKIERNIKDKFDWYNYKDKLSFDIPKKLRFHFILSEHNNNFNLYKLYNSKYNSEKNLTIKNKILKLNNNITILFLNCNNFNSVNVYDNKKDNMLELNKLIDYLLPNIVILGNTGKPNFINKNKNYIKYNNYKCDSISCTILLKKNYTTFTENIINDISIIDIKEKFKYPKLTPDTKTLDNYIDSNLNNFISKTEEIINKKNILFIIDRYINKFSPELNYLEKNNFTNINLESSFYKSDNFIFIKNYKIKYKYLVDFNRSYYYPQLIII
jgi:hypothetical protein